ncbi:hypothetical protein BAUCODRAFT_125084 [Baudoinia panamericana UAMH 10762]|uniref:Ribosomal protein S21 n=1 Tax=Baudoinia panamericana (strain UAMH 10762) TaxID=717646 RepID=M2N2J9_BAUPA|nr:uncharacterized protein BAUCODRAFT_125084 [Baudoinia panamericana UAMH 10762]EMC93204.1 hypothetical protein BAUCODRAFT_125084 [Baudoinia panamericana UAMH 10762]
MELYRVGEAFLRSPQPLLPFLAPAAYQRATGSTRVANAVSRHCRSRPMQSQASQPFSTSLRRNDPAPAAAAREPQVNHNGPSRDSSDDTISRLLDSTLDFTKGTPAAPTSRTSRFKSSSAQAEHKMDSYRPSSSNSSLDDLLAAIGNQPPSRNRQSTPSSRGSTQSTYMSDEVTRMLDPSKNNAFLSPKSSSRVGGPPQSITAPPADRTLPFKLGPSVGRTVTVDNNRGMDVGRAFRTLEVQCARNSVRKDFMRQRFHERGGLKRKRLKSERWRRRFKENFRGIVAMVGRMRKQGW